MRTAHLADERVRALSRALDQTGDALDLVHAGDLPRPTPCSEWRVARLADHMVATPVNFLALMRGEEVDWADQPHIAHGWGPEFRVAADDLFHEWHSRVRDDADTDTSMADWQCAELAVHTWDLLTALGRPTDRLEPEVAERGLAFMRANLGADNRGGAFGPEQRAPEDAGPYERIAAYAGRRVR